MRPKAPSPGRRLRALAGFAAAVLVAFSGPGLAATYRLDDSASRVIPPSARWQWAQGSLRTGINTLEMNVRVDVRIDTREWEGRAGRVYMVLPVDAGGPVTAQWESQGRLLGGRLVSGERALVFSGTLPGPFLEDTIRVRITTDARVMTDDTRRMNFHFELDTP